MAAGSPGKTPGFLRGFSGLGGEAKMQAEQRLCFGPYRFTPQTGQLWRGKHEVRLTPKALALLQTLVIRSEQVVTKDELFQAVWPDTVVSDDALTSCMQELRRALGDDARKPRYIETVHRRGFRFIGKVLSEQSSVVSQTEGVSSQEEVASSQYSVVSGQEQSRVQSLMPSDQEQDSQFPLADSQTPAPTRSWLDRRLAWRGGVLLVAGTLGAVWYLFLPIPSTQPLTPSTQELPLPDKPSIAVMPFTNMSGDPEQEYFSDGLTDDLITDLARLSQLFVIARHSVFTYKGKAVKVQEVSKELGVQYVLEGSVRKTDKQVRINAQLVDATTGHHLWAERYDRELKEIFALQDDIRQKIVTVLRVKLLPEEQSDFKSAHTDNLEAYDYYLRGVEDAWRFTKEANAQARQMFEKAIELDSQYAAAYARLGNTYYLEWAWQWSQGPQSLEQAFALEQRAIALDASLPYAHNVLGQVYLYKKQHEQALAEVERAIALAPNDALGYLNLGNILNFAGRSEETIGLVEKAMRLNPRYPAHYLLTLSVAYRLMGRYEEAIVVSKRLLTRNPNFLVAHASLAIIYSELGREEEARAETAEVLRLNSQFSLEGVRQTWPYKDQAVLERILAALRKAGLK